MNLKRISNSSSHHILHSVAAELLRHAKGLAFLTVVKGGLVWSCGIGTGLVVARLPPQQARSSVTPRGLTGQQRSRSERRWSAPSAIGTIQCGW